MNADCGVRTHVNTVPEPWYVYSGERNASILRDALTNHPERPMSGVAPNRCGVSPKVVSIFDYQVPQYL